MSSIFPKELRGYSQFRIPQWRSLTLRLVFSAKRNTLIFSLNFIKIALTLSNCM